MSREFDYKNTYVYRAKKKRERKRERQNKRSSAKTIFLFFANLNAHGREVNDPCHLYLNARMSN